jgi:phosphate acyltransferase
VLVGDRARIEPLLHGETAIEIVHSAGEVPMDASASQAVRKSEGTSLGDAVDLVRERRADAVVSAGNSGAFLAIALIRLRTIPGIARPAIGAVLPGRDGPVVLCDAGANVDCKPEWMMQFGVMGSAYARAALGIAEPRVAVISVGEERTKGNTQSMEAAELLERAPVRFVGNIEGKDIFHNHADVVVADGFVGNVILKTAEGSGTYIAEVLRESFERAGPFGKLGGLLSRGVFSTIRKRVSYSTYGGAPLLGVRGNCIVAHGRSDKIAICNAIHQAAALASADLVGSIGAVLAA